MRLAFLVPLVALLAAAPAAAQGEQAFRGSGGYSLRLPASWARVPDEALDVVRRAAAALPEVSYEAGFRAGKGIWPAPPIFAVARVELESPFTREQFAPVFAGADARQAKPGSTRRPPRGPGARWTRRAGTRRTGSWGTRLALRSDGSTPAFAWNAIVLQPVAAP